MDRQTGGKQVKRKLGEVTGGQTYRSDGQTAGWRKRKIK